ncbi:hypothetical protein ACFSL6_11860 [Paenibacillus thailandensis]|uniref:Uncharacterized protein n=1 Tax=Paenibacillus thailandensis TaxID=393250 RepID=A0ABW5R1X4_9BACL
MSNLNGDTVIRTEAGGGRRWYRRKRNAARIGIVLVWLLCTAAVFAMYDSIVRTVIWTQISMGCAALLFFSIFVPLAYSVKIKGRGDKSKVVWILGAFIALLVLYAAFMLVVGILDMAAGPAERTVTVAERWDPTRGGDKIKTADGEVYEVFSEKEEMKEGGTYNALVFRYSNVIVGEERVSSN